MQNAGARGKRPRGGDGIGRYAGAPIADGASVGQLFKELGSDSAHLIQQEIALAKTELRETTGRLGRVGVKLAVAAAIAIPGAMAITAFLVIGIGDLLNENYWLGALIVGVALTATAAILAKRAMRPLADGVGIPETTATLRDDARWAKQEAQAFKREFTAPMKETQ
jgi:uncharacterized membrane protein YqjE